MDLYQWGWNPEWNFAFEPFRAAGRFPARVLQVHRDSCVVASEQGEGTAVVTGKLRGAAESQVDYPAVGDWVAASQTDDRGLYVVHAIIPRKSSFSRKTPGVVTDAQVIAANVDVLFLVTGLDRDFNLRRVERYLTLAWESGAKPVVVLSKADVCADVAVAIAEVETVAIGVDVVAISAIEGVGLDTLRAFVLQGRTIALVGSSGVGKSTLINALLGEEHFKTGSVRQDDGRGRHITSHRELVQLPGGGLIIDSPGMRELQLWAGDGALERSFEDIALLAAGCRFRDCSHADEPGCAVRDAVESGALDSHRLDAFFKLQRELHYLERKKDGRLQAHERAKWKQIHKEIRAHYRHKR